MNKLTKVLAVALMVLAALLASLAWWLGRQPGPESTPVVAMPKAPAHMVVVAADFLPRGQLIDESKLKLIESNHAIPDTFSSIDAVSGRIPMVDLEADALVSNNILVHGLAKQLQDGERAVAIPVDEIAGAGNQIEAGDYVDVFMTLRQGTDIEKGQARLIASRMRVLAYGSDVMGGVEGVGNSSSKQKQATSTSARSAVLAVPMSEINPLLLAVQNGKLTLALRSPRDTASIDRTLFPSPSLALTPRNGLGVNELERFQSPDNQAYAGIELLNWSSGKPQRNAVNARSAPTNNTATPRSSERTLEVIKGTQREQVRF